MGFAERLKYLREEKGVTQKEVAKSCDITTTCICNLENGLRNPTGSTLLALANFFNVSTDYLIGRTDDLGAVLPSQRPAMPVLNENEMHLIALYRSMNEPQKIRFFAFGEGITSARDKKYMS